MTEKTEVVWHPGSVSRKRGCVVWFTGLSGSGKSTIANRVDERLNDMGIMSFVLDGDNIRHGLNASPEILASVHSESFANRFGLGFGADDREENIRRIGCVAELFCCSGLIALTAFVSPYRRDRDLVRQRVIGSGAQEDFIEVFVDTPLELCEQRDPKGLYKKARAGTIKGFTGLDDPYEAPLNPEIGLNGTEPVQKLVDQVIEYLIKVKKIVR
jgi:adenylylsulfate kinase